MEVCCVSNICTSTPGVPIQFAADCEEFHRIDQFSSWRVRAHQPCIVQFIWTLERLLSGCYLFGSVWTLVETDETEKPHYGPSGRGGRDLLWSELQSSLFLMWTSWAPVTLILLVWQKQSSCGRVSLMPVVSDVTVWFESVFRSMHVLKHRARRLPTHSYERPYRLLMHSPDQHQH